LVDAGLGLDEANALAWQQGFAALRAAIDGNTDFVFETTLGGHSVTSELLRALAMGREVIILYVGLATPELHIRRVAERVARGGHDIPEAKIRERYDASRENLLKFIGTRATVRVWDNSEQNKSGASAARLVLDIRDGKLRFPKASQLASVPTWAKGIVAKALQHGSR
jgi:predicted ABC-type ATPase